jgi:hypothetical protein
MSSQELTVLLSTALGGVLAIIGGFSASYFMLMIHRREENRKVILSKLEELYELSITIKDLHLFQIHYQSAGVLYDLDYQDDKIPSPKEIISELRQNYDKMKMTVSIYIPQLRGALSNYSAILKELRKKIQNTEVDDTDSIVEFIKMTRKQAEEVTEEFQKAIEKEISRFIQ